MGAFLTNKLALVGTAITAIVLAAAQAALGKGTASTA